MQSSKTEQPQSAASSQKLQLKEISNRMNNQNKLLNLYEDKIKELSSFILILEQQMQIYEKCIHQIKQEIGIVGTLGNTKQLDIGALCQDILSKIKELVSDNKKFGEPQVIIVEKIIEKPVQVVKVVHEPIFVTKEIQKPVFVTKQVEKPVFVTQYIQKPVYVQKNVEVPIFVQKFIEKQCSCKKDIQQKLIPA